MTLDINTQTTRNTFFCNNNNNNNNNNVERDYDNSYQSQSFIF